MVFSHIQATESFQSPESGTINLCTKWATSWGLFIWVKRLSIERVWCLAWCVLACTMLFIVLECLKTMKLGLVWKNIFNFSPIFFLSSSSLKAKILTGSPFCPLGPADPGNPGSPVSPCQEKADMLECRETSLVPQNPTAFRASVQIWLSLVGLSS